jgi:aspartate racemase
MSASNYFDQLVGIIGGTGPEATNYFTSLLVKLRGHVGSDQEHIPFLLLNNPQIPDRSKHLLFNGESPLPEMVETGLLLKRAGATFLVIPCHTAHVFTEELEAGVGLPVMNMIDLTITHLSKAFGKKIKVGLLATDGTLTSNTYKQAIEKIAPSMRGCLLMCSRGGQAHW